VIVETMGVGQSETAVADLVDCFVVLMIAGGGDELQAIKKGLLERADVIAFGKSDQDGGVRAAAAAAELRAALALLAAGEGRAMPQVLTLSAQSEVGLDALWHAVEENQRTLESSGLLHARRRAQQVRWMRTAIEERLTARLRTDAAIRDRLRVLEVEVAAGRVSALVAAEEIAGMLGA
jgi:LAO/AO transport system kinase